MKKSIIFTTLGLISLTAVGVFAYMNSDYRFSKSGGDEVLYFDNSKPGKWKVKTVEFSGSENNMVYQNETEICIKQEQIEKSMKKKLKEKLAMEKLDCTTIANRNSKNDANFTLSCVGLTPEQQNFGAKIEGTLTSDKEKSSLILNYTMAVASEDVLKIKKDIVGERVGECK